MTTILRPGQRILNIPGIGISASRRAVQSAAAADWWLAGGAPTPIAVYQPKGAASLAASYVNLANPGTYDAAPGTAPTLDASGLVFNGTNQYLTTGITPGTDQSWSMLARFSGASGNCNFIGTYRDDGGAAIFGLNSYSDGNAMRYYHNDVGSDALVVAPSLSSGVSAIAGRTAYRNGVAESSLLLTDTLVSPLAVYLGAWSSNYGPFYAAVTLQAVAIWDTSTGHATWMPEVMAAVALI